MNENHSVNEKKTILGQKNNPKASDLLYSFLNDADQSKVREGLFHDIQKLHPQVREEQILTWLSHFNKGMQYVKRKFGSEPADIKLVDHIEMRSGTLLTDRACYLSGKDTIVIPHNFIGFQATMIGYSNLLSSYNLPSGSYISADDLPFIEGFEEAYHSFQEKRDGFLEDTKDITTADDKYEQEVRNIIPEVITKTRIRYYKIPDSEIVRKTGNFVVVAQSDVSKYLQPN